VHTERSRARSWARDLGLREGEDRGGSSVAEFEEIADTEDARRKRALRSMDARPEVESGRRSLLNFGY